MDIVALKNQIIDKIKLTESNALLEEVRRLLDMQKVDESSIYQLNEKQQNAISEAREDLKKGRFLSSEQAKQDIDQWLRSSLDFTSPK